nr:hypothetical protein [Helicobacter pylori]
MFKKQSLNPKKEILRYNVSAIFNFSFLVFHGKLLFRIYPHNRSYGGYFATIFSNLKKRSLKNH